MHAKPQGSSLSTLRLCKNACGHEFEAMQSTSRSAQLGT